MKYKVVNFVNPHPHPQSMACSCWAASIANATNKKESDILSILWGENKIIPNHGLLNVSEKLKEVLDGTGIPYNIEKEYSWSKIKAILDDNKIFIYHFDIVQNVSSHFVNIYGYEETNFGKWLYIYDPKPDRKGNHYLLNFENLSNVLSNKSQGCKGLFYFGDTISNFETSINLVVGNVKKLGEIVEELIQNENLVVSNFFKEVINLKVPATLLKGKVFSIKNKGKNFADLENVIEKNYANFQIVRNDKYSLNFVPLVKRDNDEISFLTGLGFTSNYIESIFSIDFLNQKEIKDTVIQKFYSKGFGLSIYIENENYRTVKIFEGFNLILSVQIDIINFTKEPLVPQDFDLKQQQVITPSDLKEMQQAVPKEMRNLGKF